MSESTAKKAESNHWQIFLFLTDVLLTFVLIITQISTRKSSYSLKVGDVSPQDISAPRTVTYVSKILTEQARKDAADIIGKVYLPADPSISRTQLQNLRYTLNFITTVRNDQYSTNPQKIDDINHIVYISLDEDTINQVLDLASDDWDTLQSESLRVLEEVMQNSIRDNQVVSEIENIPTMINYYINPQLSNLVNIITRRFVVANSLYSEELTEKNKEEARSSVQDRERTFVANQTIILRGQIVTDLIYEALDEMGLVHAKDNRQKYISAICIIFSLSLCFLSFYFSNDQMKTLNFREALIISIFYLVTLTVGRLLTPNHTILPYLFPIQALGLTVASMFGGSIGSVMALIISILVPYDFIGAGNYSIFYIITSMASIYILGKGRQMSNFIMAGIFSGLIGIPLLISSFFTVSNNILDTTGMLTVAGASLVGGILSCTIALIAQYFFSGMVGLTTSMQLMEILRPESPLLQFLLQQAPGTYQHSLMVSNLSEQAAKDIGADQLLTRAGAMYHDCGKALNPSFFMENQASGNMNLHNDITPQQSAAIIIQHVEDGVHLIKKYHLPECIINFVREHHGTNITRYQYGQALQGPNGSNINIADFTYPGPKPQSKETALVMLADSCEARARADKPQNDKEIEELVKSVVDLYSTSGQLDDSPLTFEDLTKIRIAFARVLHNTYHPRVKYPTISNKMIQDSENKFENKNSASTGQ